RPSRLSSQSIEKSFHQSRISLHPAQVNQKRQTKMSRLQDALIVGIDFGTTFSGVAAAYSGNAEAADDISVIKTWPGGNNITSDKVPTEISYAPAPSKTVGSSRLALLGNATNQGRLLTESAHDQSALSELTSILAGTTGNRDAVSDLLNTSRLGASKQSPGMASTSGQSVGPSPAMRWGFQLKPNEQRLRCLKLFLDPRQPIPEYISLQDMRNQLQASGRTVKEAVADYLEAVFKHTKEILARRYGQDFVSTTKLQLILTVPAVWSEAAKHATLTAAQAAGMDHDLALISEPEAAAVYTLQAIQPNHLKAGHNFVVVDAGGGTVDLISYSIKQLTPLRLEEVVAGSGGCCGASFLNIRFQDLVRSRLGASRFSEVVASKPKSWFAALRYFEDYVKRNFDPNEDTEFNLPFPGLADDAAAGIESGFLTLTSAEIGTIFGPIIADVIKLVDGQLRSLASVGRQANGLILVGGFGQSECLLKCLKARFASQGIQVLQPVNAWTAVVRGAVLRGLEGTELVINRKSRRNYGVVVNQPFDPTTHPLSCRVWDDFEEQYMASKRMMWYILKGQSVSSSSPILLPFSVEFDPHHARVMTQELIVCDEDDAPAGYDDGQRSCTRVLCKMIVNLQSVPTHLWERKSNSRGKAFVRLHFEMGMQMESGGLRFDFRVDGVVYGKVTAKFEVQDHLNPRDRPGAVGMRPPTPRSVASALASGCIVLFLWRWIGPLATGNRDSAVLARRRNEVKAAFQHAWDGYAKHCFGKDTMHPVTNTCDDEFGGWGATAIDSLTTAIMFNNDAVVLQILRFIATVDFTKSPSATSAPCSPPTTSSTAPSAHLARDEALRDSLYQQMLHLGDALTCAFNTPSGVPRNWVDPAACTTDTGTSNTLAGVGSMILEFMTLSRITNHRLYAEKAKRAEAHLLSPKNPDMLPWPGLYGSFIAIKDGALQDEKGSWGALADSFYEYLLKAYIYDSAQFGAYLDLWKTSADSTIRYVASHPYGHPEWTLLPYWQGQTRYLTMDSLSWFAGGNFILGGLVTDNQTLVDFGLAIADTAGALYRRTRTGLGAEYVQWTEDCEAPQFGGPDHCAANSSLQITDANFRLRPEVLETWYYAYRATGDVKYREWTWRAFQRIEQYCKTETGYASLSDVDLEGGGTLIDKQESFVFAEVMKYIYLIHLEDPNAEYQVQDSRRAGAMKNLWVYNTEAHPFKVAGPPV
ncbi:glycoside hydrolase family 47 protein, partial [Teratosphaeria destructans]